MIERRSSQPVAEPAHIKIDRLEITFPPGDSTVRLGQDGTYLLDGKPIQGLVRLAIVFERNRNVVVTMDVDPSGIQ